jgi:ornithine carbamoyltransferase
MKHFLHDTDLNVEDITQIFNQAALLKSSRTSSQPPVLKNQTWGLIFYKNSTRTRISFEVGINELSGNVIFLDNNAIQINRGESIQDTAQVLSRYLHGLIIRTHEHEIIETFAKNASIPVVNALTNFLHPCQTYTDVFTILEQLGKGSLASISDLEGKKVVFYGDTACNMANSWILIAKLFKINLVLCGPEDFRPKEKIISFLDNQNMDSGITFCSDPKAAAENADVLYTDVWVSMGDEAEARNRINIMQPYSVTPALLKLAKPSAIFMHCMPTHPGMEVTQEVLDSPQAILYDQAENRLHVQKAILAHLAEVNRK